MGYIHNDFNVRDIFGDDFFTPSDYDGIIDDDSEDGLYGMSMEAWERLVEQGIAEHDVEMERVAFEGKRLCGKNAHAYKAEYENQMMLRLRREGKSYRQIAKAMGIKSPSTVRNRLNRLEGRN
jgi:hypothetical protein